MESVNIKTLFSDEALAIAEKHVAKFPEGRSKSAIIAILHLAQAELGGWLSPDVMDYVASILKIEPIEVYEVATFYSQYYTEHVGKYVLEVCHTGPCALRGADEMVSYLEKKLGIKEGETTADGLFTLKGVECLASCGSAPMMQCGLNYHENLTEQSVDVLLDEFKKESKIRRPFC